MAYRKLLRSFRFACTILALVTTLPFAVYASSPGMDGGRGSKLPDHDGGSGKTDDPAATFAASIRSINPAFARGDVQALKDILENIDNIKPQLVGADFHTYYGAYGRYRLGLIDREQSTRLMEACVAKAQSLTARNADFAEAYALIASCSGAQLEGKPEALQDLLFASMDALNSGLAIDPQNPRLLLARATSVLFTPPAFGGGSTPAVDQLKAAAAAFEQESEDDERHPFAPTWGHDEVYLWFAIVRSALGDQEGAVQALERSLLLNSQNAFISRQLLPAAKGGQRIAGFFGL